MADGLKTAPKQEECKEDSIIVEEISKHFGKIQALDKVSLRVPEGLVFALLGPNGSGKTTLIRILTTLLIPDGGSARVGGFDIRKNPSSIRPIIGLAGQYPAVDEDLTGKENLEMIGQLYHLGTVKARSRAGELLETFELADAGNRRVKTYSGGMRRRLDLAATLVAEPSILFLDEPTTGLDPVSRIAVWEMLDNLRKTRHLTMLITTHYMEEADKLCDRIAIVDHGKLVALGTPVELKNSVAGANVVEVHFDRDDDAWPRRLQAMEGVTSVQPEGSGFYRVITKSGSKTTMQIVELAASLGETLTSLSVQNTTLDDVFIHYTGRQLRDEQVKPVFSMPPRPGAQP